jgi:hypothetical protein
MICRKLNRGFVKAISNRLDTESTKNSREYCTGLRRYGLLQTFVVGKLRAYSGRPKQFRTNGLSGQLSTKKDLGGYWEMYYFSR